ncbi:MAG: aspartate--tRNA ligase [Acholeplasmatales bacterium]|nr:aspartate--tRNA ligase [Acholeplasmatales bacterium]
MNRTHNNGELRITDVNKIVELKGWVAKKRNLGGLIFIDIRDKFGITQIAVKPDNANYEVANQLKNEYVIQVKGKVIERESKNKDLPTGDIEIDCIELKILNTSIQPPIIIADNTDALEDTRLKYRYLDLRRPCMQKFFITKSKITQAIREYMISQDFLELETPILAKSTPEGARDYLVPSRLYEGEFYALPQSPQIFKQLYMIAGFEKYFQIARCFRDEDLRADRQPEFTQIDVETSFLNAEEIQTIIEGMFKHVFKKILNVDLKTPFRRISYEDSMDTYGSDKPDLRFGMVLFDCANLFNHIEFMAGGAIKGIKVENANSYTRKNLDELTNLAKKYKAKGLAYLRYQNNELSGSIMKFLDEAKQKEIISQLNLKEGDLILITYGKLKIVQISLGALRSFIAKKEGLLDPNRFEFAWIVDWPVFEWSEEDNRWYASTHPFTAPKDECLQYMKTNPEKCYANAYDIVLNGYELGSGSLRIYNQDVQKLMFETLGLTDEDIKNKFGFFTEALKYGTPPHGGIGMGLERITMIMTNTDNIKDVVAFPKTQSARDLMCESPSSVEEKQLIDVHIDVRKS